MFCVLSHAFERLVALVVGTGRVRPSPNGESSFQVSTRSSGRWTPAVAGRPSRLVESEKGQRQNDVSDQSINLSIVKCIRPHSKS